MKTLREHVKNNIPNVEFTDKGVVSTTNEALDRYLAKTEDPLLRTLKELMKYEKAKI